MLGYVVAACSRQECRRADDFPGALDIFSLAISFWSLYPGVSVILMRIVNDFASVLYDAGCPDE